MWPDLLVHTKWQGTLFTTNRLIYQWNNNPCVVRISLPMIHWSAFPGAYFSGLSEVLECSGVLQTNDSGATGQVSTWPSKWVLFMIFIELKWTSNETIWQCSTCTYVWKSTAPHHPQPLPLCNHLWYRCKTI